MSAMLRQHHWEKGVLYMVYSSFFLSLLNFNVKICIGPLGVIESTFLRYFTPLLALIPVLLWRKEWHELRIQAGVGMHLLRSVCAVTAQVFLNYYLTRGSLLNATVFWATGPIYVPIIVKLLFRQKTPLITWVATLISLLGVAMMVKPTDGIFSLFSFWGFAAGISMAFTQIVWGQNVEKGSVMENLFYLYLFSSVLAFLVWITIGETAFGSDRTPGTPLLWISIVSLAITSIGNQLFRSKAYQQAPPYLLTPILYVAVVGSGILDILVYHNWPDVWGYCGFGLIAIGTLIKWWYLKKIGNQLL